MGHWQHQRGLSRVSDQIPVKACSSLTNISPEVAFRINIRPVLLLLFAGSTTSNNLYSQSAFG